MAKRIIIENETDVPITKVLDIVTKIMHTKFIKADRTWEFTTDTNAKYILTRTVALQVHSFVVIKIDKLII